MDKLPHITYFLMRGPGKQRRITRLHYTSQGVHASSWSGKSSSGGGQACRSALHGGGRASADRTWYREHVGTPCVLGDHGVTRVRHQLPCCSNRWAFYIDCDPRQGVASQKGHNLQVRSSDHRTKNRYAAWDDQGHYIKGHLQAMLLNAVCNTLCCHLLMKVAISALRIGISFNDERLKYLPGYFFQHLSVWLLQLIQRFHRNNAVRDCNLQKSDHADGVPWKHVADRRRLIANCLIYKPLFVVASKIQEMCSFGHEDHENQYIP